MAIQRYPHLAHWGAFTAVVEDGKLIRCEPFASDPAPSAMLDSIVPLVYSDKHIRRPAERRSWLQKRENSDGTLRGKEDFVEVGWDVALDLVVQENQRERDRYGADGLFAGFYGWSSAGRFHHARSQGRRFYFSGGGAVDQQDNYSWRADDTDFLRRYCVGYDALRHYLTGERDGMPKTPEWASAITGISAERICRLAQQLIGVRSFITCAYSVPRAHRGEQPYWMMIVLSAMLGQIGLPGGGFSFGHGSINGVGNERIATPALESPSVKKPGRAIPVARIADMLLNPGQSYTFKGETHRYPKIHLIHWAGGNPFHHHQRLNRLVEGWRRPETVIVQDIVWTPAAQMADIMLPVTTTLERNDLGGSSRDRHLFAMHQARDEQAWLEALYEECRGRQQGVEWPEFKQFWLRWHLDVPKGEKSFVFFDAFRNSPEQHPLQTPSGKIELYSDTIARYGYEDFAPHPEWRPPVEWLGAETAECWPLHFISIQPSDRLHSQLAATPQVVANKTAGKETLYMHPQDANARGIVGEQQVEVFNARGRIYAGVRRERQSAALQEALPDRSDVHRSG